MEYCGSYWTKVHSHLNIATDTCSNDPVARLEYVLNVLTVTASKIRDEDGIPPLVIFDNTAQNLVVQKQFIFCKIRLKMHLMKVL